jgi:hypothetical protein
MKGAFYMMALNVPPQPLSFYREEGLGFLGYNSIIIILGHTGGGGILYSEAALKKRVCMFLYITWKAIFSREYFFFRRAL